MPPCAFQAVAAEVVWSWPVSFRQPTYSLVGRVDSTTSKTVSTALLRFERAPNCQAQPGLTSNHPLPAARRGRLGVSAKSFKHPTPIDDGGYAPLLTWIAYAKGAQAFAQPFMPIQTAP
jgi:hypothetical protein